MSIIKKTKVTKNEIKSFLKINRWDMVEVPRFPLEPNPMHHNPEAAKADAKAEAKAALVKALDAARMLPAADAAKAALVKALDAARMLPAADAAKAAGEAWWAWRMTEEGNA